MDLSLSIAIGSSLQIALFVAPVLVFLSLPLGNPLTLEFNNFELIALTASGSSLRSSRWTAVQLAGGRDAAGGVPDPGAGVLLLAQSGVKCAQISQRIGTTNQGTRNGSRSS